MLLNTLRPRHVLVVDDELLIRWSLREALEAHGYQVTEAADAAGARRAITDGGTALDAIVLDYRLPDSKDLGLLDTIRRIAPAALVIMMTAYGTADMIQGAFDLGAYRVVSKPFEIGHIVDLVDAALAAR
jgi:DNA-binding NtrC family response regulator